MKKMRTLLLASAALLAVASLSTGLSAVNVSANTSYTGFEMDGASVRAANPVGIRFHTVVPEALKVEGNTFGTLIIPKATLGDNTLDVNNTSAANVAADKWQSATEFTAVLGGVELGGVIQDFDAANYNSKIVARSYVKDSNGTVLYYTAEDTRTVAQVAAYSLADPNPENQVSDPTLLKTIVHTVLGENKFELVEDYTVTVADEIAVDTLFSATNGNEGLTAIWTTSDENTVAIKTDADGFATAVVPKAIGTATLTAKIGDYTAQIDLTVADETLAAPTNLAIDRNTGTLSWNAVEGAKSYEVSVSSWKTGNTVYSDSVTGNSVKFTENAGDIYTVSVNAVATFGTAGTVATEEIATYTPANASKDYMLFDFENEASLDITKTRSLCMWHANCANHNGVANISREESVTDSASITKTGVMVLSETSTSGFTGVVIKLPVAVSISDIATISFDWKVSGGNSLYVVLSDGTNMMSQNIAYSNNWSSVALTDLSAFSAVTGKTAPTDEITEIYFISDNGSNTYHFDNISIATFASLGLNFNQQKTGTSEYYLADFSTSAYDSYLSKKGGTTYNTENGYLDIQHTDQWQNAPVYYTLPKKIAAEDTDIITVRLKLCNNDLGYGYIYLFDETDTSLQQIDDKNKTITGTNKVVDGWLVAEFRLDANIWAGKSLSKIVFGARNSMISGKDGYVFQVGEITYTKA